MVSLLWCNMTSQGKVQGAKKNREWTGQKEGKNIEQAEKQQKRETCENDSTIIRWDLFTAEGVRSEKTCSTSRIPDKLEEFVTPPSFLSSHPSNQSCLKPFPSLQPLYLGNRVKPLIAHVPYQGTWCSGGQTWANQTYTHIHVPSNANKIAKISKMQSNQPRIHISQRREQTKLQSGTETALISGGDSDGANTEKDTHILLHTQPHL